MKEVSECLQINRLLLSDKKGHTHSAACSWLKQGFEYALRQTYLCLLCELQHDGAK